MGNQYTFNVDNYDFPRSISMGFMRYIPMESTNKYRIGKVYIMVHKTREQQMMSADLTYTEEKRAHHSLMIDVAGTSNDTELRGVWFHLTVDVKTRETDCCAFDQPVRRSSLIRHSKPEPDRLRPPDNASNPREWASLLKSQAERIYNVMTNFESLKWSESGNCQQYVRRLVESLGLNVHANVQLAGDTLSIIIDVAILAIEKQATKEEENRINLAAITNSTQNID